MTTEIHDLRGLTVIEALAPQVSRYRRAFLSRPELDYSAEAYACLLDERSSNDA